MNKGMLSEVVELQVSGMDGECCARDLEKELKNVSGVLLVNVSYKESKASIQRVAGQASMAELVAAVEDAGFDISK